MSISASKSAQKKAPSGSTYYTLTAKMTEDSYDVANNTSTITVKATFSSSSGSFSSGTNNTLSIQWYDNNSGSTSTKASTSFSSISAGGSKSCSKTFTVSHKADGTLSGYAKAVWDKKDGNSWTPDDFTATTSTTALTSIPRESNPTMGASSYNINSAITVNTNRKLSSYTHTIQLVCGGITRTIGTAKAVGASATYTLSANDIATIMATIPNSTSITATVKCITYTGTSGTQVGSQTQTTFTYKIPNTYKAVINSSSITETALTTIGLGNADVVKGLSKKTVSLAASGVNGATISSVKVSNGTQNVNMRLSNGAYTADLSSLTSGTFTFTVIDSRGFSTTSTTTGTFYNYNGISIDTVEFERETQTGSVGHLNFNVNYYSGTIGNITNAVEATYQLNTWTDPVAFTADNDPTPLTYSVSAIQDLNYKNTYTMTITATDSFGTTKTYIATLNGSVPLLWLGKDTVRVGGAMIPNLLGMDYDFTSLGNSESPTGLGLIDGNSFKQVIDGKTFYLGSVAAGANATYTLPFDGHYEIITVSSYKTHCSRWLVATGGKNAMFQSDGFGQWAHTESDTAGNMNGALSITNSNYAWYDYNSRIDRTNGVVSVHFIVKPVATESTTGSKTIANVLKGYLRPQTVMRAVCQGSSQYTFCATINTNGNIAIERYGYGTTNVAFPAGAWLNIFMTYIAQTHPVVINCDATDGKIITVSPSDATVYVYARYLPRYY